MLSPPQTWYHGGIPGLEPGDLILPPRETGVLTLGDVLKRYERQAWKLWGYDTEYPWLVYITQDLDTAILMAALWTMTPWRQGNGHVYRVIPESRPVPLPDDPARRHSAASDQPAVVTETVTPGGVGRDRALTIPKMPYSVTWLEAYHRRLLRDHDGSLPAGAAGQVIRPGAQHPAEHAQHPDTGLRPAL